MFRSFIADYGVPLMVLVWTTLSFNGPSKLPSGVPRRLLNPLPWESASIHHSTVIQDMCKVPLVYVFAAIYNLWTSLNMAFCQMESLDVKLNETRQITRFLLIL